MQLYRYNNRKWFGWSVGTLLIATLLFSFALIFRWLPTEGNLNILWETIRYTMGGLVLLSWGVLNVTAPTPPGFVIAFAEFGEEKQEDGGYDGLIRPARRTPLPTLRRDLANFYDEEVLSQASSRFLDELRRTRHATPSANPLPPGKTPRALPSGATPASATSLALAQRPTVNGSAADSSNTTATFGNGKLNTRSSLVQREKGIFLNEFCDEEEKRPVSVKRPPLPANFFDWEDAIGSHDLTEFLQAATRREVGEVDLKDSDPKDPAPMDGVNIYKLVYARSRETALREAEIPKAAAVIWGWHVYHTKRDFVPVFEFREPLENSRPARGQMQILGLKSFDLGLQTARHHKVFTAFVAGLGAYGYAPSARHRDENYFYQKARAEFNLALTASYMYGDRTRYDHTVDRAIIYFFLGNTHYYLNDLENAANAYREALALHGDMIEARHNMGVVLYLQNKLDFAQKSLIKVVQLKPDLAMARLNLGVTYLAKKQYTRARQELLNTLKLDPRRAAAERIIGVSYRQEGDYEQAIEHLVKSLEISPDGKYAEAHVDLGLVYTQQANSKSISDEQSQYYLEGAVQEFETAIKQNPNLPEAHYHLGRLLHQDGQEDEAGLALLEAVRLRPDLGEAHELLADIYEKRGRLDLRDKHLELMAKARQATAATTPDELVRQAIGLRLTKNYTQAREELIKALGMDPRNTKALYELGVVYQELEESDKALETFQTVLKLPAPPVEAYNRISGIKFQNGEPQAALDLLRQAANQNPREPNLHYYLGNAYRKQKTEGKAIESYIEAIKLDPNMVEPHINLGMIYLNRKQVNDAILQFREVVRIRPEDYETHYFLGRSYMRNNQIEQAIDSLEEAISLKSDFLDARLLLGEIYLRQAEPERAIEQLQVVQTYNPNDLRARELMGKAYAQAGQLESAIETFQDIIVVAPDSVSAHYNLGVAYVSLKRYREAISEFAAVIQNKPDDADAYFNMGVSIHELLNGTQQNSLEAAQLDVYFHQEVEAFQRAIQLRPTNPEPFRYLGQLYLRINNSTEAMKFLNEYNRLKRQA